MKKTVKGLIVAASVAAVVGVGAVSFAAWSAGDKSTATTTGETGSIVTVGAISATETGLSGKKLVPYDQTVQLDTDTMTTGFSVVVAYTGGNGTPTMTMKAEGTGENAADKLDVTKLEYSTTEGSGYTAFADGTDVTITAGTYYFRLNSNTTADMNKGFTITFTADAPTA